MNDLMDNMRLIQGMTKKIGPVLAGHDTELQGAVLADLLASWICGHSVPGDLDATADFRAEVLDLHIRVVHVLIAIKAA